MFSEFPARRRAIFLKGETPNTFRQPIFYGPSRMRTRKDLCTLDKMLSLLPAPKHNFTPLSTVEKKTCKRGISAIFFGTLTIFIRAVPNFFCRVNGS